MPSELASLYKSRGDLGLKEGQTITVSMNVKKNAGCAAGGGFMSRHAEVGRAGVIPPPASSVPVKNSVLLPPPAQPALKPNSQSNNSFKPGNTGGGNQGWATFD